MSDFLYWIPKVKTVDWATLKEAGLSYCFDERTPRTPRYVNANGPDGGDGCVVAHHDHVPVAQVIHNGLRQIWRKIPGRTTWVGMYPDDPPTPENLQRKIVLEGEIVPLGGADWLIPVARGLVIEDGTGDLKWFCQLPMTAGVDDDGGWTRNEVDKAYKPLWEAALAYWEVRETNIAEALPESSDSENDEESDDNKSVRIVFDYQNQNDAALTALATNYRVDKMEVVLLNLFTDETTGRILEVMVDAGTWRRWMKKKIEAVSAGLSTDSGERDD